jgi:hypothetical protein
MYDSSRLGVLGMFGSQYDLAIAPVSQVIFLVMCVIALTALWTHEVPSLRVRK